MFGRNGIRRQRDERIADPSKSYEGKQIGDADDLPRDHGIVVHFAGGQECRIKNVTIDDFENASAKVAVLESDEGKPSYAFVRVKNGPCFQLKNVDYVEDFNS